MKNLRQRFTLLFLTLLLLLPNLTFAQTEESDFSIKPVPIEELDTLAIEDTYSALEILTHMKNSGCTEQELNNFIENHQKNLKDLYLQKNTFMRATSSIIRYSLCRMNEVRFTSGVRSYCLQPQILTGLEYVGNSPSPDRVVSLEAPYIYTGNGAPASFVGNMTYKLVAGNEFYILIQGKTYKDGQMKVSGGVKVGLGKSATASITVKSGNGFLKDISHQDRFYSAGMSR